MVKTTILGTEYEVELTDLNNSEYAECDGRCFVFDKKIVLRKPELMLMDGTDDNKRERFQHVLLHELIHGYSKESGTQYDTDEVLVDWIAFMIPKIVKSYDNIMTQFKEIESGNQN